MDTKRVLKTLEGHICKICYKRLLFEVFDNWIDV